jgi:predicted RNase H-like HicB family nuclease
VGNVSGEIELTVFVWREGKWFVAYEPSSGVSSQGRTVDEALKNIREALELYLEDKQDVYPIERVMITKIKIKSPLKKLLK